MFTHTNASIKYIKMHAKITNINILLPNNMIKNCFFQNGEAVTNQINCGYSEVLHLAYKTKTSFSIIKLGLSVAS